MKLVIENIGMLATPVGTSARSGREQGNIRILNNAWIAVQNGIIAEVGTGAAPDCAERFDAGGKLVTPGLVDPHTHLVFGGWRQHELAMKLRGVPYLDILAAGDGILSTVRSTRDADIDTLKAKAAKELKRMLSLGVTTCEAKSGYGLNTETELKMLRVVQELPYEQIAQIMDLPVGTVKSRLARARLQLKKRLDAGNFFETDASNRAK